MRDARGKWILPKHNTALFTFLQLSITGIHVPFFSSVSDSEQKFNIQLTLNIRDEFPTLLFWSWYLSTYPQNEASEWPWCSHLLQWTPWIRSPLKFDRVMLMNFISWNSGLLVYLGTVVMEVTNALQCFSSFEAEHPEETLISEQTWRKCLVYVVGEEG